MIIVAILEHMNAQEKAVCAQRLEHNVFVSVASLLRAPGGAVRLDSGSDILPGEVLPIAVCLVPAFHRRFVYAK